MKIDKIEISTRTSKDVEFKCPKCGMKNIHYDVDTGKMNFRYCDYCGEAVEYFVDDF